MRYKQPIINLPKHIGGSLQTPLSVQVIADIPLSMNPSSHVYVIVAPSTVLKGMLCVPWRMIGGGPQSSVGMCSMQQGYVYMCICVYKRSATISFMFYAFITSANKKLKGQGHTWDLSTGDYTMKLGMGLTIPFLIQNNFLYCYLTLSSY